MEGVMLAGLCRLVDRYTAACSDGHGARVTLLLLESGAGLEPGPS